MILIPIGLVSLLWEIRNCLCVGFREEWSCGHPVGRWQPTSQREQPWRKTKLLTFWSWMRSPQNCEKTHFYCLNVQVYGTLVKSGGDNYYMQDWLAAISRHKELTHPFGEAAGEYIQPFLLYVPVFIYICVIDYKIRTVRKFFRAADTC